MIYSDKSGICIGQDDDPGTFIWCRSNEIYKDDYQKKISKSLKPFMIWSCVSFKGYLEMEIIISTINTHVYIEILYYFLILNQLRDDEVGFQDDNAFWHSAKGIKAFLQEKTNKNQ